jgi:hypothetical protein
MENWHLPTTAMRIFSLERNVLMFLSALAAPKHAANALTTMLKLKKGQSPFLNVKPIV